MEQDKYLETIHPQLAGRRVLLVDDRPITPRFETQMKSIEKMKVTVLGNLLQTPDLAEYMEINRIDYAIIYNAALGEVGPIIAAVQKGKVVLVQEKDPDLELNLDFNTQLQNAGVKTFPGAEPDLQKAFGKCLDYLAGLVH